MGDFVIKLRDLESGEKPYRFELSRVWLDRALEGTDLGAPSEAPAGHAHVRAALTGKEVLVRGEIDAHVTAACARCLGAAVVRVRTEITALYVPAPVAAAPPRDGAVRRPSRERDDTDVGAETDAGFELDAGDIDREHYTGETVEIDDLIRDQLVLEIPFNPLCRDDCPGIEPVQPSARSASTRDVIDPRFAPLLALKLPNKE